MRPGHGNWMTSKHQSPIKHKLIGEMSRIMM